MILRRWGALGASGSNRIAAPGFLSSCEFVKTPTPASRAPPHAPNGRIATSWPRLVSLPGVAPAPTRHRTVGGPHGPHAVQGKSRTGPVRTTPQPSAVGRQVGVRFVLRGLPKPDASHPVGGRASGPSSAWGFQPKGTGTSGWKASTHRQTGGLSSCISGSPLELASVSGSEAVSPVHLWIKGRCVDA